MFLPLSSCDLCLDFQIFYLIQVSLNFLHVAEIGPFRFQHAWHVRCIKKSELNQNILSLICHSISAGFYRDLSIIHVFFRSGLEWVFAVLRLLLCCDFSYLHKHAYYQHSNLHKIHKLHKQSLCLLTACIRHKIGLLVCWRWLVQNLMICVFPARFKKCSKQRLVCFRGTRNLLFCTMLIWLISQMALSNLFFIIHFSL